MMYCDGCPNSYAAGGWRYNRRLCSRGSEFRLSTNTSSVQSCSSCDYTNKVQMPDHKEHREMCQACITTPRFFANNYCYRCDSNDMPILKTQEEKDSCTKCPNRIIDSNSKCVLIQTEEK